MTSNADCRRKFLCKSGAALAVGLAGCASRIRNTSDDAAKLVPRYDPDDEHQLIRVAVSVETVVASTIPEPESSPDGPGSAYVFERSSETWGQEAELSLPEDAPEDEFGDPIAIDGDTVLIGSWYEDTSEEGLSGTAYVFDRSGDGGWNQRARLVPDVDDSEGNPSRHVHAIAIDGDTAILGCPATSADSGEWQGSAFAYRRTDEGWHQQAELVPDDSDGGNEYGHSVALAGDVALIGAPTSDTAAGANAGAVFAFERSNGEWVQRGRLVANDDGAGDKFGSAVALSERTALVAGNDDTDTAGSVSVFERNGNAGWSQRTTLLTGGESSCIGTVSLEGETALVGDACQNSTAVFVRTDDGWDRRETLVAPNGAGETFGNAVSLSDDTAVVADWRQSVEGGYGAAYVFSL
ncbi:hypothetical protein HALLA_17860 [Halostagnicola larsenii XH-48]|uniref:PKD domain-containing protein n=1 Tax=Halostagnicola larsenii XH-48 TaxID=797299 RepID=W0JUV8_9EURY|nr:FG-GAP repeat protein [Halostagnicola larsenii]AHG01142.1 hypothetical protein HALLA_17860 [Halostagnicola larsenii XH-48]